MNKILVIFDVPSMSVLQYDNVMKDLDKTGAYYQQKRAFHFSASKEKGSVVIDVWDSAESLQEFAAVLFPILAKNGVTPPTPQVYPIHNSIEIREGNLV
jgi:hypothetical protein